MADPALTFFSGTPFIIPSNNTVDKDDTYVGTGAQTTFSVVNKPITSLGTTIQAGNVQYYLYNGGFTVNTVAGTFTLATAPPLNTQIVAPGMQQLTVSAFDQDNVVGVTDPRVGIVPFWLIDPTTINQFKYEQIPTLPGIEISVIQLISGANAQTSWIQLACADASGNSLTYGATGAPLYTAPINAFTTLASTASSSNQIIFVNSVCGFYAGDYISINLGASNQEITHIIAINATNKSFTLDPTGLVFNHAIGELVFDIGRKFWLKCTIPLNANNNTPVNLYNLGLRKRGAVRARP